MGGPQCRLSILRKGNVPCHYFLFLSVVFKRVQCHLSDLRKGCVKFKGQGPLKRGEGKKGEEEKRGSMRRKERRESGERRERDRRERREKRDREGRKRREKREERKAGKEWKRWFDRPFKTSVHKVYQNLSSKLRM